MRLANANTARGFFVYKLQSVLGSSLNRSDAAGDHAHDDVHHYIIIINIIIECKSARWSIDLFISPALI